MSFVENQSAELNARQRADDLARAREDEFDVVVIGGGITGCGAALDAATRGLKVLLVESRDFAAGTSSKSSKLIHGGLRYLEMLDFGLVREALAERKLLLQRIAPHLVRPVPFVWPLTHRIWERAYIGAGLVLYDTMAGRSAVPRHRHLGHRQMREVMPGLNPAAFTGGLKFYDAIEDDARMTMAVARTARLHGAAVLTRARASGLITEDGVVRGIDLHDELSGANIAVRARRVVSAAGPWTPRVRAMLGESVTGTFDVRPSKGVHIVVPRSAIDAEAGVLMRTEKSVLFIIPWGRYWLIGDTDTDWSYDVASPIATGGDVTYLLEKANSMLARPLSTDDIVGVFAGLRPLVQTKPLESTTKISREHQVTTPVPGLTLIAGGKYTTYRLMARDLIDAAVGPGAPQSRTDRTPLIGAAGYQRAQGSLSTTAEQYGVAESTVQHLIDRYGGNSADLLALISARPELAERLSDEGDYIGAEIVYACTHEGALDIEDILERRTRIRIQYADSGIAILEKVVSLAAEALGWTVDEARRYAAEYRRSVEAEQAALRETDDGAALSAHRAMLGTSVG